MFLYFFFLLLPGISLFVFSNFVSMPHFSFHLFSWSEVRRGLIIWVLRPLHVKQVAFHGNANQFLIEGRKGTGERGRQGGRREGEREGFANCNGHSCKGIKRVYNHPSKGYFVSSRCRMEQICSSPISSPFSHVFPLHKGSSVGWDCVCVYVCKGGGLGRWGNSIGLHSWLLN